MTRLRGWGRRKGNEQTVNDSFVGGSGRAGFLVVRLKAAESYQSANPAQPLDQRPSDRVGISIPSIILAASMQPPAEQLMSNVTTRWPFTATNPCVPSGKKLNLCFALVALDRPETAFVQSPFDFTLLSEKLASTGWDPGSYVISILKFAEFTSSLCVSIRSFLIVIATPGAIGKRQHGTNSNTEVPSSRDQSPVPIARSACRLELSHPNSARNTKGAANW